MRQLIWQFAVSLDGFLEGPQRELDWFALDADFARYVDRMLDGVLLGRVTYEGFAAYWPTAPDAATLRMNTLPKLVFSRTLPDVAWQHARLAAADVVTEVRALKRAPGRDLAVFGSGGLAATLVRHDLIDEYRAIVMPVVLGAGRPVLRDAGRRVPLAHVSTETFASGAVLVTHRPRREAA